MQKKYSHYPELGKAHQLVRVTLTVGVADMGSIWHLSMEFSKRNGKVIQTSAGEKASS